MKIRPRTVFAIAGAAVLLVLIAGFAAPYINADKYGERLRRRLSAALARPVEFRGKVQFSLFRGGFSVEDVVIHEDPSIGLEPIAYVDSMSVQPRIWALAMGRFEVASIRLEGASINLSKSGPASEWGHWNFASFVDRSVLGRVPAVHVRDSRIHFKFGEAQSVFYLTDTDLDISPPGSARGGWSIECSAKPARTDRTAQGLGAFKLKGHWYLAPERVDLDLQLDRSGLGEITALVSGQTGGVHGTVSSRLHLAGPLGQIGIVGRINIEDVHRWDLLPQHGRGWPLDVRGRLDLTSQQLELQSASVDATALPLWLRFRASNYLSQPQWAIALNWNRFPMGPLLELARHMGLETPNGLQLVGTIDGAIGYSGQGSLQGELALHDTAVTIPGSPPLRFEQAEIVLDRGHAHLMPTQVRGDASDEARIEADYGLDAGSFDLAISTEAMRVGSLRAQVALAAVPWLEQVQSGTWSGNLHYRRAPGVGNNAGTRLPHAESEAVLDGRPERPRIASQARRAAAAGWSGDIQVEQAAIPIPGLADPVHLTAAHARIDGAHVIVDQVRGEAGKLQFTGDYAYQPGAARPHRLRLRATEWNAADLETECMPVLHRSSGLIARALGRVAMPDWLRTRGVDATVQVDRLMVMDVPFENVRARAMWDGPRIELDGLQAKYETASLTGRLSINLRGARPVYSFSGRVKGLNWQSGKLDAQGTIDTAGTGTQVVANLVSSGTFSASALDLGQLAPYRSAAGSYTLAWSPGGPRFHLTGLSLRGEEETYTGHGASQDDGKLLVVLTDGAREIRVTGPPAKLRVEEASR